MRRAPCVAFFCDAFFCIRLTSRVPQNFMNSRGFLVSGRDRNGSIVKIEIATVRNAHRTPADMLALMQHARVAACCCSTHAWLHTRAQHCSGQLQSATAMEQPGPAIDSCPRSTASAMDGISSHDDRARCDSCSCMLRKDRGLGTLRKPLVQDLHGRNRQC